MKTSHVEINGTVYKLRRGNIHPFDDMLKFCPECKKFKDKIDDFTDRKCICKDCRNRISRQKYKSNEKIRDYHLLYNKMKKDSLIGKVPEEKDEPLGFMD